MSKFSISKKIFLFLTLGAALTLTACDDDQNKVAQAQKCLDQVTDANPSAASACLNYINGVNSQQANILKCSITLVSGGLTTSRVMNSFNNLNSGDSTEVAFMTLLTMQASTNNASAALAIAQQAASYCNSTGDKGLMFLGNMAVMGTSLSASIPGIDFSNISEATLTNSGNLTTALSNCQSGSPSCDKAAIGNAAIVLSGSYCAGPEADKGVCQEVNTAVAGGASAEAISDLLLSNL